MLKRLKRLDDVTKYLLAATMLAVALFPKFPLIDVPGTFVSIRLEDVLLLFCFIIWLVGYFAGFRKLIQDNLVNSVVVFLTVGLLSFVSAFLVGKTITPHIGFLHWARRVEYFIPLLLGLHAIKRDKKSVRFYVFILLAIYFYAFTYGFGQRYLNWPIVITQNEEYSKGVALRWVAGSHVNSTFAGHYDLATFLVMTMPIVLSTVFVVKSWRTRIFSCVVFLAGLWLLVASASRISLVSYMIGAGLALVLIKRYKAIPIVIIISVAFIGFSANLQARYARIFEVGKEKLQELRLLNFSMAGDVYAQGEVLGLPEKRVKPTPTPTPVPIFEDRSTSIRFNVEWPRALRAFAKNPLLGTGYSSIGLATDNDYLRLLGEVGILGLLAFLAIMLNLGSYLAKFFKNRTKFQGVELAFVAGFIAALPGLFLNAFFIDIFEASKFATLFWLFAGLNVSLIRSKT